MSRDIKKVKVWNVEVGGAPIRVATIEQGERKPSMCDGCAAPCCRGMLLPVMNEAEFQGRKFPIKFTAAPDWLTAQVPRAQAIATLGNFTEHGCSFYNREAGLCTVWPNCPQACLSYDCREDPRPEIKAFVKQRERTWRAR